MLAFAVMFVLCAALNHGVADVGPPCWCCHQVYCGQAPCPKIVSFTSVADCQRIGGECYHSKEEASRYCNSSTGHRSSPSCWCYIPVECIKAPCPPGRVIQTTLTDCQKHGGHCFSSQGEALSYRNTSTGHRSSPTCWCCISRSGHHRVVQTTAVECQENGGNCYHNRYDAYRDCSPPGAVF